MNAEAFRFCRAIKRRGEWTGFTLIELLVVIAIIAILASLLLPALAAAKRQSTRNSCVNNQHEIAVGLHMYVDDYREYYPAYYDWATWGGGTGTNIGLGSDVAGVSLHGGGFNQTNRQLYSYLKNPNICHCPADIGDPLYAPPNGPYKGTCWNGWGNSYLMIWIYSEMGVEHIGGQCNETGTQLVVGSDGPEYPNKRTRVALKPATKIILGDWNWFSDRTNASPQTSWHAYRGKRVIPFLFGDGHNEVWSYSPADEAVDDADAAPDINYRFW